MSRKGKGGFVQLSDGTRFPIASWSITEESNSEQQSDKQIEQTDDTFLVRWMQPYHIQYLLPIEHESCELGDAWEKHDFKAAIRDRQAVSKVALVNDYPVGYAVWGVEKGKLYLVRLAVSREVRRCSVGSALLANGMRRLSAKRTEAWTRVDERNVGAQLWLKANGWIAVGIEGESVVFVFREEWRE